MLPADFTAGVREGSRVASTDFHRIARRALIPAPLAALIMEERQEVSLLAANRVLAAAFMAAEGSMEAVAFMAEAGTGDSVHIYKTNLRYGEQDHAHHRFGKRDSSWEFA
jgi:hypothetical protein